MSSSYKMIMKKNTKVAFRKRTNDIMESNIKMKSCETTCNYLTESTDLVKNMSLYIPHVFQNITKEKIITTFEKLDIGKVSDVELIIKITANDSRIYNSAYIHFQYWNNNITNRNIQSRLLNYPEKETRIVYDDPWFWSVLENKSKKRDYNMPKVRINIRGIYFQKEARKNKSVSFSEDIKEIEF